MSDGETMTIFLQMNWDEPKKEAGTTSIPR